MELIDLVVTRIVRANAECIFVYLSREDGMALQYEAGQFLTFIFNRNGKENRRSYSLFTTPSIDAEPAVVIKRVVNGEVSRFLIDHLAPGDRLQAIPASGRFTLPQDDDPHKPLVFISAGSGISPVYSLIRQALLVNASERVLLIYQNRSEEQALFVSEFATLAESGKGRFTWIHLLSNPSSGNTPAARLNNTLLEKILLDRQVDFASSHFYICGPPAFMRMCQFVLHLLKVPDERMLREIFYFESSPVTQLTHSKEPRQVQLTWNEQNYAFTINYPESILSAALRSGIKLPYSCRGGRCSTCTLKCSAGSVIMSINEVLTARDLQQGLILTCVGYPETDISLQYPF